MCFLIQSVINKFNYHKVNFFSVDNQIDIISPYLHFINLTLSCISIILSSWYFGSSWNICCNILLSIRWVTHRNFLCLMWCIPFKFCQYFHCRCNFLMCLEMRPSLELLKLHGYSISLSSGVMLVYLLNFKTIWSSRGKTEKCQ